MTESYVCFTRDFDANAEISNYCNGFDGRFIYEAGRCYPRSGASEINTAGAIPIVTVTPQECYDTCVGHSDYMGLELYPPSHGCVCNRPGRQMLTRSYEGSISR